MFFEWFDCHVYSSSSPFLRFERTSTESQVKPFQAATTFLQAYLQVEGLSFVTNLKTESLCQLLLS